MYTIIDLRWDRANLFIKLNKKIDKEVYICFKKNKFLLETKKDEIRLPFYNTPVGSSLLEGTWSIQIEDEVLKIDTKLLNSLEDKSRIFRYKKNLYAMLITYYVDDDLYFFINCNYMMKNNNPKKMDRMAPYKFMGKIRVLIVSFIFVLLNIFYKLINLIFMKSNSVLFLSENSDELSVNMLKLYERINSKYKKKICCINLYRRRFSLIRLKELISIATSKYIIVDNYVGLMTRIKLNKRQSVTQLWHAGIGFKAVGYARFGKDGSPHPFVSSHRKYKHAVVDNKELIDIYQEVFGCSKDIFMDCGIPRLDDYLDKDTIKEVSENLIKKHEILKDKKIILFSPTYRGAGAGCAYYDYSLLDLKRINDFCVKNNFVFVIKMHPFVKEKIEILDEYKSIVDLSEENINDLIYVSDIMITDYSSCAYEFSFFDRLLIFYRFDKDLYEYSRAIHTVDQFCDKQFEVLNFDDLMDILVKNKDIDISKRFSKVKNNRKNSSIEIINNIIEEDK